MTPGQQRVKDFTCKYLWKRLSERSSRLREADSEEAANFFWKHPDFRLFQVNDKAYGHYASTTPGTLVLIKEYDWNNCRTAEREDPSFDRNDVKVLLVHTGKDWLDSDFAAIEEYWISSIVLDRVEEEEYGVSFDTPEKQATA